MLFSKSLFRTVVITLIAATLGACAEIEVRKFETSVDSISTPAAVEKKRYLILPGEKNTPREDLQFLEFAGYVEKAMSEKGFARVSTPDDSDVIVFLTYGIGGPEKHLVSYTVPHFGQTGVSGSHTTGTVTNIGGGMSSFSGMTTYTPTYGVTGYSSGINEFTTFPRFIMLDAFDSEAYRKENAFKQVWRTRADSIGMSNDLRLVFPYMLVSMKPHISTNTGKKIVYQLPEDDASVKAFLGN